MISELKGSVYQVLVTNSDVCEFARSWPCHGLDTDAQYLFEFDARNGDLISASALDENGVERDFFEGESGSALVALSEDATLTGAEQLNLVDVIAIRYPDLAAPAFYAA